MIETKNGETFEGTLRDIDWFMNIKINQVIQTSIDGSKYHKCDEVFIRGNSLKTFTMDPSILENFILNREKEGKNVAVRGSRGGFRGRG